MCTQVKQLSPYTKALKPQEVPLPKSPSISRTTSHDSGKEAPPKRRKLKLTMGMQNAEFSMVNFVIKYEIDVFKKRLTHACEMIAETFQLKFGFVLNKKDFTIVSLKELRDRLVVGASSQLRFQCLVGDLAVIFCVCFPIRQCIVQLILSM